MSAPLAGRNFYTLLKPVPYLRAEDAAFPGVWKSLEAKDAIVTIQYFCYSRNEVKAGSKVNSAGFYAISTKSRPWHELLLNGTWLIDKVARGPALLQEEYFSGNSQCTPEGTWRQKTLVQASPKWPAVFDHEQFILPHKSVWLTHWPLSPFTLHEVIFEDIAISKKCCSQSFPGRAGPLPVTELQGGKGICLQSVGELEEQPRHFDPYFHILNTWLNFLPTKHQHEPNCCAWLLRQRCQPVFPWPVLGRALVCTCFPD